MRSRVERRKSERTFLNPRRDYVQFPDDDVTLIFLSYFYDPLGDGDTHLPCARSESHQSTVCFTTSWRPSYLTAGGSPAHATAIPRLFHSRHSRPFLIHFLPFAYTVVVVVVAFSVAPPPSFLSVAQHWNGRIPPTKRTIPSSIQTIKIKLYQRRNDDAKKEKVGRAYRHNRIGNIATGRTIVSSTT